MRKGVMKLAAYCMISALAIGNSGVKAFATGLEDSLAGVGAAVAAGQQAKEEAGVVKVAPTEYDTIAIAQVDEYVNIRDAASTESGNIVGKLYNNCKAEILGKTDNGWYLIQSGGVTGYVAAQYFVTGEAAEALAAEVGTEVATVKEGTETLMVRSSADSNSDAISMVGDYEKLQVLADEGDWVKVAVDDDVVGYVSKEYVDCSTEFNEAETVEEVAARQAAIEEAYARAIEMQAAAYDAMNVADGAEAAYAASEANAALAEAMMLASEQEYDYEAMDLAAEIAAVAQDTAVAAVWAQEAEDEYARIAAEEEAQRKAEEEYLAYLAQQEAQSSAATQEQVAEQKEQAAAEAWQAAVDAQEDADANWSEEAQAEADAAAQAAMQAAAEAEAARQQAEAEAQAAAQAAAEAAAAQQAQQQETQSTEAPSTEAPSTEAPSTEASSSESSSSSSSSVRQSLVSYALQFVGNPYVYGGNSLTNGIDCSGYTQQILAHFGVSLPRTAASQANTGTPVSLDNIQPGDLLFYSSGGGIGHVSIYIGNGQVVHASNPTSGIIISSLGYRTPCCARSYF